MDKFRVYLSTYPGGMCNVRRGLFLIIKTQYKHKDNRNRKVFTYQRLGLEQGRWRWDGWGCGEELGGGGGWGCGWDKRESCPFSNYLAKI